MISCKVTESGFNTKAWLNQIKKNNFDCLDKYGKMGVEALSAATPIDSGVTASSWGYTIKKDSTTAEISFTNSSVNKGVNVAILIQYGHGTRNGGYVKGVDYINPAMRPIFEKIADDAWREVTK